MPAKVAQSWEHYLEYTQQLPDQDTTEFKPLFDHNALRVDEEILTDDRLRLSEQEWNHWVEIATRLG